MNKYKRRKYIKTLLIDIETAPSEAYIWQAKTEYVPIEMIKKEGYLLSWAAKWLNIKPIIHSSIRVGMKQCLLKLHKLIDKADVLIAHNGIEFDFKKINSYFLKHNILPPSPYKVIDTLKVARSQFRLTSNKLDFIAGYLGVGHKLVHTGFHLWKGCMNNDKKSWDTMIRYNINDVKLLEKVYLKMLPWIKNHPNYGLYTRTECVCKNCGSVKLHKRGTAVSRLGVYNRYQCQTCGSWMRDKHKLPDIGKNIVLPVMDI